jgi:hypothetical protein
MALAEIEVVKTVEKQVATLINLINPGTNLAAMILKKVIAREMEAAREKEMCKELPRAMAPDKVMVVVMAKAMAKAMAPNKVMVVVIAKAMAKAREMDKVEVMFNEMGITEEMD